MTVVKIRVPSGVRLRHAKGYCKTCGQEKWHWKGCDEKDGR